MNTEFLQSFLMVHEQKSFTRAALAQHISQSTLSNRIQELEKQLGEKLFHRERDEIRTTAAGEALLPFARDILSYERKALKAIRLDSATPEGIKLGCVHLFYDCFLRKYLERSLAAVSLGKPEKKSSSAIPPRTTLILKHSREILASVQSGRFDFGVTHHPLVHPAFYCKKICREPLVLVCSGHNHEAPSSVNSDELRRLPMLNTDLMDRTDTEHIFGHGPNFTLSFDVASKVLPFLENSELYAILPRSLICEELKEKRLRMIDLRDPILPPLEYYVVYARAHERKTLLESIESGLSSFLEDILRLFLISFIEVHQEKI